MPREGVPNTSHPKQEGVEIEHPVAPSFIREFSKENSQEDRDATAATIHERRRERDSWRTQQNERMEGKENIEAELENLGGQIEAYNSASFLSKIKDYLEYRNTKATLEEKSGTLSTLQGDIDQAELSKPEFKEVKILIDDFYNSEKTKWANVDHTPEDVAKNFSEDHLAELSVEEYALLMRRFPGEMVTHVTRQGIRDHAPMLYHTGGLGKFHDGFKGILESGRLQSSIGIALQEHSKEEAMARFLKLDKIDQVLPNAQVSRREKALLMLSDKFSHNMAESNAFADTSAVHLAAEKVADGVYGAERGNEIFFAFPSAYVASQLRFGSGHGALNRSHIDVDIEVENNQFIYTKNHEGIPIDSGLVFIPEDAQVDPKTGSKYKIGERGEPIIPKRRTNEILSARFEKLGFVQTFVQQLPFRLNQTPKEEQPVLIESAFKEFGITDSDTKKALLDPRLIDKLANSWGKEGEEKEYEEILTKYFHENADSPYELADNTVSSKEFWEKYFQEHPEQKPSKVVFYSGGDPSRALNEWREKSGIVKRTTDETFGFPEHQVSNASLEANQGKERFESLARKVIDDYFPEDDEPVIPDPEEDLVIEPVVHTENSSAMKERSIESPELFNKKEASKIFLSEERTKLAQEIWAERKAQQEKISALRINTEAAIIAAENMEASQEDRQYGEIAELQSSEASELSNRLESSSNLNEQDVQDEKENISQLIVNSENLASLKMKLREHYEKADEIAKGKYESLQKSVEQTMLRNNVFIVHAMTDRTLFKPVGEGAGYAHIEGGMETDLNVLLSIEPSISASSVAPGVDERGRVSGLINDSVGVLLGGGQIKMAAKGDMWSVPTGLKQRTASDSLHLSGMYVETSSEGIDSLVKKRQGELNTLPNGVREADNAYNEIIVDNPEIAGFYQMADKDEGGRYWAHGLGTREKLKELHQLYADPAEAASGHLKYTEKYNEYTRDINRFKERLSLAKNNGLLHYIMSPERQVFECASINDDGTVNVGREVTPEEIAKGRAGLPPEKRKEIGEKLIEDKVFNNQETIEEAREIVNEL